MRLLVSMFSLLPLTSAAQESVTLAEWNIERGYDSADNVFTPNGGDWSDVSTTWFNKSGAPILRPDTQVGDSENYALTAWSNNR